MYKIILSNQDGDKHIMTYSTQEKAIEILNAITNVFEFCDPVGTCYTGNGIYNDDIKIEVVKA